MPNKYSQVLSELFSRHYRPGDTAFEFSRSEVEELGRQLDIRNLGDILYSFRFRNRMPKEIAAGCPPEMEWRVELAGRGKYRMRLVRVVDIVPRGDLRATKVPDATPEIVMQHAMSDEQATLARIRYNRLIDIFLCVAAYSLQNHLRTTVPSVGQIEIDELYVAVNRFGEQFVVPVQAKGSRDRIGAVQALQDLAWCAHKVPHLQPRIVAAQSMGDDRIALFELVEEDLEIRVADERHYLLVAADAITTEDLESYRRHS